jgi:PAS domain S-box-containing protein
MTKPDFAWWPHPPMILRYAVTVACVTAAITSQRWMEDYWAGAPASLALCAVMFSAWFGGLGPSLLAMTLAIVLFKYFFVIPVYSLAVDIGEAPRLLIFALSAVLVGLLAVAQRGAAESLRRARDQLSRTVRELEASNEALRVENTERNRVEQALRENEQRFRDFADTASDWLWETGPDHRFIAFSERLGTLGVARAQALGRRRWDLAGDVAEDPEKWRAHIAAHEAHQPFRGFVYRIIRADGATVSVEISGKPFFDCNGRFVGYRGTGSNITARIRGEQAEKALRQAQAELAHVSRLTTLGELTASIAHEVNQPLAAIVTGGAACLRWLGPDRSNLEEARAAVKAMIDEGHRASEVIQRLRALCRKTVPQKVRLDINDVIDEVVLLIQHEVLDRGVSLRRNLSPTLTPVFGDRVQLQQVIINLVMNGVEAMLAVVDRPRDLLIRTHQHVADQVLVAVQDSGIGIDPENVSHLFNSFFTTKPGGMGMGLSICRSILEAHEGRLWVSPNTTGHGATFQFTLSSCPESDVVMYRVPEQICQDNRDSAGK